MGKEDSLLTPTSLRMQHSSSCCTRVTLSCIAFYGSFGHWVLPVWILVLPEIILGLGLCINVFLLNEWLCLIICTAEFSLFLVLCNAKLGNKIWKLVTSHFVQLCMLIHKWEITKLAFKFFHVLLYLNRSSYILTHTLEI